MAAGISKLLQLNDSEVVGVFAQLGYVDEPRLAAILAANYASTMQVSDGTNGGLKPAALRWHICFGCHIVWQQLCWILAASLVAF